MARENLSCDYMHAHKETIQKVEKNMPDEKSLISLSELFKVLGDVTRLRILFCLFEEEMCVCDISTLLDMNISAISHQLKNLKNANLVKYRRCGKHLFYSLSDEHVRIIIGMGIKHMSE